MKARVLFFHISYLKCLIILKLICLMKRNNSARKPSPRHVEGCPSKRTLHSQEQKKETGKTVWKMAKRKFDNQESSEEGRQEKNSEIFTEFFTEKNFELSTCKVFQKKNYVILILIFSHSIYILELLKQGIVF